MEQWRNVPGYEGLYQISIDTKEGKCRRLYKNGNVLILSNNPRNLDGRIIWSLSKNNKRSTKQAGVWIALTYPELIENEYFEGAQIDHKDTDSMNNQPSNLRWTTPKENSNNPLTKMHRIASHSSKKYKGKRFSEEHKKKIGEAMLNHPSKSKAVEQYTLDGLFLASYPSAREAQRITGVVASSISWCCTGAVHTDKNGKEHRMLHPGGYIWKFSK